jgi:hypothetical protein
MQVVEQKIFLMLMHPHVEATQRDGELNWTLDGRPVRHDVEYAYRNRVDDSCRHSLLLTRVLLAKNEAIFLSLDSNGNLSATACSLDAKSLTSVSTLSALGEVMCVEAAPGRRHSRALVAAYERIVLQ